MTITWGSAVSDSTNAFRIGYEFTQSPTTISNGTTSATVTLKIYLATQYYAYDSGVSWAISGNIAASGTTSFNHTSGTSWSPSNVTLLATRTRTVTPSFSGTVATSITASVGGLAAIAGTASVSGTWTTAKRPIIAPDAPSGLTLTRVSDSQTTLNWTNNNPSDAAAPYQAIDVDRYDWAVGAYVNLVHLSVATSYTASGQFADAKYSYRVRATNTAGASAYVAAGPILTTPDAPTGVTATRSGTDIQISWIDNSPYNDEFEVWHRLNGVRDASPLITVSDGVNAYTHVSPSTSQPHSYEIRAKANSNPGATLSAYSAVSNSIQLTDNPPTVPTSVTPATSTVTTPKPTLGGTLTAISTGQLQKMSWQFATDSGFTANVKNVTEADADLRASGATTENPTLAQLTLTNGTWYMRAKAIDINGVSGPWSSTATLTVNTPAPPTPTAVTPAAASTVTTMTPTLGATVAADGAGRSLKLEWTLATDSGFTANVKTIIEADADYRTSGATTEVVSAALKISGNGTKYLRARSLTPDGAVSAWSSTQSFTLTMAAPPTPTQITPVDISTISTDFPTLGATLGAASESRTSHAEWQMATDSGFTTNLKTITEAAVDNRISGATTEVTPPGSGLFQGTWYLRCRAIDQYGQAGSYSSTQTFTVSHKPTAIPTSPINDTTSAWVTTNLNWNFSDPEPTDTQSAYQIIIERNDTGAVLFDSTKVVSAVKTYAKTTTSLVKDVKLRWKIRVWDSDDVVSNYSAYQLFTLSDAPVVTITSPTEGQQITTGQPTVTWTTDVQTTQANFRVVYKRTSDGATILDSNTIATSAQTYSAPNNILENGVAYSVTVTVTDTQGLQGFDTNNFTTLYQVPDPVIYTVDASMYESDGYINIDWSDMQADGFFIQWNVYRRQTGEVEWTLIAEYINSGITYHRDWTATTGDTWEYSVTQSAGRSGVILDSVVNPTPSSAYADGSHYWLINPDDESNNLRLQNVTSDDFSDPYEEAELIVIGRGRKVNQGTRFGYDGSLVCKLRDDESETARSKRRRLQQIKQALTTYYLRTPFGDLFTVSLGGLSFSRVAGVGVAEYVDVTVPYKEVF